MANAFQRKIAKLYLDKASAEHVRTFPQLACFAFDTISVSIHLDGQYERFDLELLAREVLLRLNSAHQALDIGANIGKHSVFFARFFKRVVSFEPHPRTFKLLDVNAELAEGVVPVRLAASN